MADGKPSTGTVADMTMVLQWIGVLYGVLLGGCLASFGCVVSERVPAGQSIGGRSHCACGRQLSAHQNIPVLGWALSGGRARCCGSTIPARYVWWEAAYALWGAVTVGGAWYRATAHGDGLVAALIGGVAFLAFFPVLLAMTWQGSDTADHAGDLN